MQDRVSSCAYAELDRVSHACAVVMPKPFKRKSSTSLRIQYCWDAYWIMSIHRYTGADLAAVIKEGGLAAIAESPEIAAVGQHHFTAALQASPSCHP